MQIPMIPTLPMAAIEPLHIIIAVAVIIVGAIIAYYVVRAMKGKIEIELPKNGYNSGEEITGRVTLTTKKALESKRLS